MQPFPLQFLACIKRGWERRALLPPQLLLEISTKCFIFYGKQGLMCSDNKATTEKPWIWKACPDQSFRWVSVALGAGEWAHPPHQGSALVLAQLSLLISFRSPCPASLLNKCLFWCVHILPDSAIWIEWEALDLQKQPFEILHTGKKKGFFF